MGFSFFLGSQYMGELYENDSTKKDWHGWNLSLYKKYKSFKGNKELEVITKFAENTEGSEMIRLLIALDDVPHAAVNDSMTKDASDFIKALNRFYKETNFESYFKENDSVYERAMKDIKSVLPSGNFIPAMEKFYRQRFDGYGLLPSLTIPAGMAFGVSYKKNGKTYILNCFGQFGGFANEQHIRELSVHEFGHSFTNPVLNKMPKELFSKTASLYDTVKIAMENQGYNNWMSCMYEHFVRAGEVVIAKNLGYFENAERLKNSYINDRKFIYLPIIIKELELYNKNKKISYEDVIRNVMEKLKKLL